MDNKNKIYRKSGVSIACYVFAAILLIYTCYTAGSTVSQINGYYAQYNMSAQASEYITYIAQNALPYLIYTVVVFMLGFILDTVRMADPKNYMTEEEYQDAKAAKKEKREAKKIAKGEKRAAAKVKAEPDEVSVAEDFANDLDKELKAAEKKDDYKKSGGNKKYYNQNRNGNNHRHYSNRPNGNRNGSGNGNRKNNNQNGNQFNNQNKPKAVEKKLEEVQDKAAASNDKVSDVFEAKVFEEK